jgi:hypothetical protein
MARAKGWRDQGRIRAKDHPFTGYLNLGEQAGKELILAIGKRAGKATVLKPNDAPRCLKRP